MNIEIAWVFASRVLRIKPFCRDATLAQKSIVLSILCIALSVVPAIVCNSVSDSMIFGMTQRIVHLSNGQINVVVHNSSIFSLKNIAKGIGEIDGVEGAFPEVSFSGLVAGKNGRVGAYVRAVNPSLFYSNKYFCKNGFYIKTIAGDTADFGAKNCVVAQKIAERLNISVGDTVRVIAVSSESGFDDNEQVHPRVLPFKVCAIISSGYEELDSLWVFIPLDTPALQKVGTQHTFVIVETPQVDLLSPELFLLRNLIEEKFRGIARVYLWNECNPAQFENFSSTKALLRIVMTIIEVLGAVFVSSALSMVYIERQREVAILKAFGTSDNTVGLAFVFVGLFCAAIALAVGIVAGCVISFNIEPIIAFFENLINGARFCFAKLCGQEFFAISILDKTYYLEEFDIQVDAVDLLATSGVVLLVAGLSSVIVAIKIKGESIAQLLVH